MKKELESMIKMTVYRAIARTGVAPTSVEVAVTTDLPESYVRSVFAQLYAKRLLVPEPGDPSRIRMAPPFSGVQTAFPVEVKGKRYYANCVWDAFGIAAALHADAVIPASDGYSGEPLLLEIKKEKPVPQPYVAHFAIPAAQWWDDIVFT